MFKIFSSAEDLGSKIFSFSSSLKSAIGSSLLSYFFAGKSGIGSGLVYWASSSAAHSPASLLPPPLLQRGVVWLCVHVRRAPTLALKTKALDSLAQESDRRDPMPCICIMSHGYHGKSTWFQHILRRWRVHWIIGPLRGSSDDNVRRQCVGSVITTKPH